MICAPNVALCVAMLGLIVRQTDGQQQATIESRSVSPEDTIRLMGQQCVKNCFAQLYASFSDLKVRGSFDFLRHATHICQSRANVLHCVDSVCPMFDGQNGKRMYFDKHDMAATICNHKQGTVEASHECWKTAANYTDENNLDVLGACRLRCLSAHNKSMIEWSAASLRDRCEAERCIKECAVDKIQMLCPESSRPTAVVEPAHQFFDEYYTSQMKQQFSEQLDNQNTATIPECQWMLVVHRPIETSVAQQSNETPKDKTIETTVTTQHPTVKTAQTATSTLFWVIAPVIAARLFF